MIYKSWSTAISMRLLHPTTLAIASRRDDIPKTVISHAWSEVFKMYGSGQSHPKMFLDSDYDYGLYLRLVYRFGIAKGCNLDIDKVAKLPQGVNDGFNSMDSRAFMFLDNFTNDTNYLFSDACSLYYKGINIFPDIFGGEWRKYVPVESHKEILRQVTKTYENKG